LQHPLLREVGIADDDDGDGCASDTGDEGDRFSPTTAIAARNRSNAGQTANPTGGNGARPSAAGRVLAKPSFPGHSHGNNGGGGGGGGGGNARISSVFYWDARANSPEQLVFGLGVQVTSVALGAAHVLATSAEGFVFAWGDNAFGQLGLGDVEPRDSPVLNPLLTGKRIRKVACGADFSACVSDNGLLQVWGRCCCCWQFYAGGGSHSCAADVWAR
jgi:hypothetical protein